MRPDARSESSAATELPLVLLVPGDVTFEAKESAVTFDGSREALLGLAGNLRRLALTIEADHG